MKKVFFGCDRQHKGSTFIHDGTRLAKVKEKCERLHRRDHPECQATRMYLSDSEPELRERIHRIEKPSLLTRIRAALKCAPGPDGFA